MRAVQYRTIGAPPEVVEIEKPVPGPGQVLLEVTAAGVCHSDQFVMSMPAEEYIYGLPLTLGHEGAGRVVELGEGAEGIEIGTNVIVYGPWGCGVCLPCAQGKENYCSRALELGIMPPGLGSPGAMAEYMIVDSPRHLVPIGDLDPVATVPLTDAGLTSYHAIKRSLAHLGAGSTAVVIGTGGLGHVGIQLLRLLTPARIIALDLTQDKLDLALKVGAHDAVLSDANAVANVRELLGGQGARAVFDFVGMQPTLDTAMGVADPESNVTIVGLGDGSAAARVGMFAQPYEVSVATIYWGSRGELIELVELARSGVLDVHVEKFSLEDAPKAYERLRAETLIGRAVVVP